MIKNMEIERKKKRSRMTIRNMHDREAHYQASLLALIPPAFVSGASARRKGDENGGERR